MPQRRFRGVIRFLESYLAGEEADLRERPEDTSVHQYVRYCVDDLKAFYYEARMAQRPDGADHDIHEDRKSTRLNPVTGESRMPSSA